jgi:hypothetical protein
VRSPDRRSEERANELLLSRYRGDEQVKLGKHFAGRPQFPKDLCKLDRSLLVSGPDAEYRENGLKSRQVLAVATAQADARSVLAVNGQADSETVSGSQRCVDSWVQRQMAVQISGQVVRVEKKTVQG